jgi:ABC-type phosphate/phosphonate transport system substrate-binding protein
MPDYRASLPMYDFPEVAWATDQFGAAILQALASPATLERGVDHEPIWQSPALAFSQTCGFPFTHELRGRVQYVATPHYRAVGCEGPNYCSVVFARSDSKLTEFLGGRAAVNAPNSMSGTLALKAVFSPFAKAGRFFSETVWTGSHVVSLAAVKAGRADVCAIDCVTVALLRHYRAGELAGLVEIARSPLMPGLPYITNAKSALVVQAALRHVFEEPSLQPARDSLLLKGFSVLPQDAYDSILELEHRIEAAGGLHL